MRFYIIDAVKTESVVPETPTLCSHAQPIKTEIKQEIVQSNSESGVDLPLSAESLEPDDVGSGRESDPEQIRSEDESHSEASGSSDTEQDIDSSQSDAADLDDESQMVSDSDIPSDEEGGDGESEDDNEEPDTGNLPACLFCFT